MQEATQNDVENAFGVLQAWFTIIARPERGWSHQNLHKIMKCCVIVPKMITKDEHGSGSPSQPTSIFCLLSVCLKLQEYPRHNPAF
jgi:hypothetical protein